MNLVRIIKYFFILSILFITACLVVLEFSIFSEDLGPGKITGKANTELFIKDKENRQKAAAKELDENTEKQILFGDLHVHSTFSADAQAMSLPITGGHGVHPVADACDFARHCSALDFWSINDHAEATTPKRWNETKETIRKCNALNVDPSNPDCVAFLGWEWTQVGVIRGNHWGHHNVILREEDDELVPPRAIASLSVARQAMTSRPLLPVSLYPFFDFGNFKRYNDFNRYNKETVKVPDCDLRTPSKDLPIDCYEQAITPLDLVTRLEMYESEYMVIPHGQSWGLYTPAGYTLDKSLEHSKKFPKMFELLETYSGHGNAEEYRSWRGVEVVRNGQEESRPFTFTMGEIDLAKGTFKIKNRNGGEEVIDIGTQVCPEPSDNYIPMCWQHGKVIYERCINSGEEIAECEARREATELAAANRGRAGYNVVPKNSFLDRNISGQCLDCYSPPMNHVPGASAQYGLALTKFKDDGSKHRFRYGFIGSSDNHSAAPGSGYKELFGNNVDGNGPPNRLFDRLLHMDPYYFPASTSPTGKNSNPIADSYISDAHPQKYEIPELILGFNTIEWEKQRGFFTTGGLAAVHSEGRSKGEIWNALQRKETYATSGTRMLLWFNLIENNQLTPMGSVIELKHNPTFEVKAMGSFEQKKGCPEDAYNALGQERVNELCFDECYNPSDKRKFVQRIEVIKVLPQEFNDQKVDDRIMDPWKVHYCNPDENGCSFTFQDQDFANDQKDASYYVRAIEVPTPQINVKGGVCTFDDDGNCIDYKLCTQDWRHPRNVETCSEIDEHRAWSSPIYVDYLP